MHTKTEALLEKVDAGHDWAQKRQPFSTGGTTLSWADSCRICGLVREYFQDPQNGNDGEYSFKTADDEPLTLRDASEDCCLDDED